MISSCVRATRCQANVAHMIQSRPGSGLGFRVEFLKMLLSNFSLGSVHFWWDLWITTYFEIPCRTGREQLSNLKKSHLDRSPDSAEIQQSHDLGKEQMYEAGILAPIQARYLEIAEVLHLNSTADLEVSRDPQFPPERTTSKRTGDIMKWLPSPLTCDL